MHPRPTATALAFLLLWGCLAGNVRAQEPVKPAATAPARATPAVTQGSSVTFEGRFGALWPQPPLVIDGAGAGTSTTQPIFGARISWYFTKHLDRRLNLQFVLDYAPLGSTEYIDPELGTRVKREGHWITLTPAIAFDVVKTPGFFADVHAGPSIVDEYRSFLLERSNPSCSYTPGLGTWCEGDFENVCSLTAYQDRCEDRVRTVLGLGAGARWKVLPTLYVGVDYTWLSHGRHVLVGTIGFR